MSSNVAVSRQVDVECFARCRLAEETRPGIMGEAPAVNCTLNRVGDVGRRRLKLHLDGRVIRIYNDDGDDTNLLAGHGSDHLRVTAGRGRNSRAFGEVRLLCDGVLE